jgi:hypothetical protein
MMDLGGIDPDIPDRHTVSDNAADLDGVAVDDPDDVDGGGVTLGCDGGGEEREEGSQQKHPANS